MLTPDPARRAARALDAAQAKFQAGAFEAAQDLLVMAETDPITEPAQVRADLLRARIAFTKHRSSDAAPLLLDVADRLQRIYASRPARSTRSDEPRCSRTAWPGLAPAMDVARAVGAVARWPESPGAPDLLLASWQRTSRGYASPCRSCGESWRLSRLSQRRVQQERGDALAVDGGHHRRTPLRRQGYQPIAARTSSLPAHRSLSELPLALIHRAHVHLFSGELSAAASLFGELHASRGRAPASRPTSPRPRRLARQRSRGIGHDRGHDHGCDPARQACQ